MIDKSNIKYQQTQCYTFLSTCYYTIFVKCSIKEFFIIHKYKPSYHKMIKHKVNIQGMCTNKYSKIIYSSMI